MISYARSGVVRSSCPLDHVLLYHGKDEATLTFLQRTFDRNLERAKKLMAMAAESKLVFRYANGSEVELPVAVMIMLVNTHSKILRSKMISRPS